MLPPTAAAMESFRGFIGELFCSTKKMDHYDVPTSFIIITVIRNTMKPPRNNDIGEVR